MLAALRRLTLEQWELIDRDFRDRSLPDLRVAWILIAVAVGLILQRYVGRTSFPLGFPMVRAYFESLPYPNLWPRVYWGGFKLVNYILVPAVCIRWILKERISDHGFKLSLGKTTWLLYAGMFLIVLPLTFAASLTPSFAATYPKYREAGNSVFQLVVWLGVYGFQFFALEFFFRGFMLFALARYFGSAAIFVAIVPYAMIHFGKPPAETIGSIVAGIALGTIALRTRSIYGGVALHCAVAWSMDLFVLHHRGALQQLFR